MWIAFANYFAFDVSLGYEFASEFALSSEYGYFIVPFFYSSFILPVRASCVPLDNILLSITIVTLFTVYLF